VNLPREDDEWRPISNAAKEILARGLNNGRTRQQVTAIISNAAGRGQIEWKLGTFVHRSRSGNGNGWDVGRLLNVEDCVRFWKEHNLHRESRLSAR
jgi:hypothetical protein